MVVVYGSSALPVGQRSVVTVGNFDGVHRGHRALLDQVAAAARAAGLPSLVYTFDPLPLQVLKPEAGVLPLLPLPARLEALAGAGVDQVVVERFDAELASWEAETFVREILGRRLGAARLVLGWDSRFGRGRAGTPDQAGAWLGVPVEQLAPVEVEGEVASSSRIRRAVASGDLARAARLLGRPYPLFGRVVPGDGRGRHLGFPTANLELASSLLPPPGVYAVRVWAGGRPVPGVANWGRRPTFGGEEPRFEVHLLEDDADRYGQQLQVDLVAPLRGERAFPDAEALRAQIVRDVAQARACLAELG